MLKITHPRHPLERGYIGKEDKGDKGREFRGQSQLHEQDEHAYRRKEVSNYIREVIIERIHTKEMVVDKKEEVLRYRPEIMHCLYLRKDK
jgi:hypothetical protein